MQCPRCRSENPPHAKFCVECATPLVRTCAQCGAHLPPAAKFCPECAHPVAAPAPPEPRYASPESYTPRHLAEMILTSKSALEGERKQVTVLFADLKGSMELLADRDPEEARRLLDPVLERMMEAVHRYEGTVNQVMGDGIMALFGAPLAHEDHAVRACYAALRMQESVNRYAEEVHRSVGVPIQIRVGLNSGEVVVRSIGSDLRMDYTAVGQTTHLAARLEQMAMPGSILLAPDTLTLVEGYVGVKPLGPRPVRGVEAPVEVYEVLGASRVRSRFHAAAARGLTRFVGREAELEQLRQALSRAGAGHGQVVAIVGEPGVGKSRLVWEVTHSHRTHGWLILESGSVSYGKATAYLPVIDLLKAYFQIEARDEARKVREKVTGKLLSLDRALEGALPALLWLLEVPVEDGEWQALDPPQRRRRTLDAIKHLLLRESQVEPVLCVFEDLHWIDSETQALLDSLVESLPTARACLLVNYRPEYHHPWSGKSYYRQLQIDPLPPDGAEALLDTLLGLDPSLQPVKQLLIARTAGNPFFLEESVRTLVETHLLTGDRGAYRAAQAPERLQVPPTAKALLAARIDRLSPDSKRLLQAAAVIGPDVPFGVLRAITDEPEEGLRRELGELQAAEFLYEARLFPDLEYTFKHALTHEVTYGGLLQERRRELHARVVAAIETLHRDRLGEQIERLAHHAVRGELREKAVHYLRQAGGKATARSALSDARAWFEQALGVLEALPESPATLEQAFDIRLELRSVLHLLGEPRRVLERLREAEIVAERLNDDRRRARVCALMTPVHAHLGELDEALASGTRALEIARGLEDLELRILSTSLLEQAHYYRGEYERAVELATTNLAAVPGDRIYDYFGNFAPPTAFDRAWLLYSLIELGRFGQAAKDGAEMVRIAESMQVVVMVSTSYWTAGVVRLWQGDWAKARSLLEHGLARARAGNLMLVLPLAVPASAWALAQLGEASEASSRVQEGEGLLERYAAAGHVSNLAWACNMLGHACFVLGRLDEAERMGDRALESSPHHPGFAAHALHLLGDIATHPDRFDAEGGAAYYRKALALAEPRGMRPLQAHCHLGLGRLYRRTGKRQQAQEHLTTATTMYHEMDMRFWLERAEAELTGLA